ncbi:TauD/TfdA family dioxygenase [Thalassomonas sp. RHCl1]|uniref:TauD/TfdA family dioxygenase n=1 Tax=Thalassomonas sp. RHCl1 TaxID=2995320 RepID=UPI00248AB437|nr:TauD/TfdA family dioxygenase [Thalassomonas sp. RHCl1]
MSYRLLDREPGEIQIIEADANARVEDLDKEQVLNWMKAYGAVLFRGFDTSIEAFSTLVRNVSTRVTLDPARNHASDSAQLVDAGTDKVGLHLENGNAPILPHLAWFYCKKAAKAGSQTTYCDGNAVWPTLNEQAQALFAGQRIKYARRLPEKLWKKYTHSELDGIESPEQVTFADLQTLGERVEGQKFTLLENDDVYSEFSVWAVRKSLFSDEKGFSNSLLGPSFNYEPPVITMENDDVIPDEVWQHIEEQTDRLTHNIEWQNHDIVLLDNTRVMHGRREIIDTDRELYNALSYVA